MTECSKPLDLVKNKIFFGAAEAVNVTARNSMVTRKTNARNFDGFIGVGIGRIIAANGYDTNLSLMRVTTPAE